MPSSLLQADAQELSALQETKSESRNIFYQCHGHLTIDADHYVVSRATDKDRHREDSKRRAGCYFPYAWFSCYTVHAHYKIATEMEGIMEKK